MSADGRRAPAAGRTLAAAVRDAASQLSRSTTPRLDAELLVAHVLGLSRTALLARLREPLPAAVADDLAALVARRAQGEPVAYLRGRVEFYGLTLEVTPDVLIPRPESELLVEWALERARPRVAAGARPTIVDVGTGSAAIALAIAATLPAARVIATDISAAAIAVAHRNAQRVAEQVERRLDITLLEADLLPPPGPTVPECFDIVTANLPYIRAGDTDLDIDVRTYEPDVALYGGDDGLRLIRRLLEQAPSRLTPGGDVGLEVGWKQGADVRALMAAALPQATIRPEPDLAGHERLIAAEGAAGGGG